MVSNFQSPYVYVRYHLAQAPGILEDHEGHHDPVGFYDIIRSAL
jgi:hypothetical protein